jgi:signal transduction histidine kinase/CheY-like chemotaxis protein
MTERYRDLSIRQKQLLTGIAIVAAALAVVVTAFVAATFVYLRASAREDLDGQAAIIAENISSSVVFRDAVVATETLNALAAKETFDLACVYANDALLASFSRGGRSCDPVPGPPGLIVTFATVREVRPVTEGLKPVGALALTRNLDDVFAIVRFELLVTAAAFPLGMLIAVLLARPLQRSTIEPLINLSGVARRVSADNDYSVRAVKQSNDEIGQLVDTFNRMLEHIERRDNELSDAAVERGKLLDREREASRLKDEFLAALSHELRTPLNAIAGWIQILRQAPDRLNLLEKALPSIERNARAQGRLIEDLLDVSRIVSGKLHLKTDVVDFAKVVETAIDVARSAAVNKRLHIEWTAPAEPCLVSGDADRLQQVVWNVLSNAVKFTPAGGRISAVLTPDVGRFRLTVTDTGIGMDPAFLPHVFDRFRQADGSFTREHGGLGLGLSIAREITDLHGGRIVATSDGHNRGSRFVIELPALIPREFPRGVETHAPAASAGDGPLRDTRVLVVDDDDDSRVVAATALTNAGADVEAVSSAAEARGALRGERFDVLLFDLAMPQTDGYTLLDEVRRSGGPGGDTPAVSISAYASDEDRQRSKRAGFAAHVAKPFEFAVLVDAVRTAAAEPPDLFHRRQA